MTIVVLRMIRDGEIQALQRHLRQLRSEKNETDSLLQEHVWKGMSERQAKNSAVRDLESSIEKIELLLTDLNEKERELKARDAELMALKSVDADSNPASERQLRLALRDKNELLQTQDTALKELEQQLNSKTRLWENEFREKEIRLQERESALENSRAEIIDLSSRLQKSESAKKRAEERLEEELRQTKKVLEENALAIKTEEKRLGERIRSLETQLGERDRGLRQRDSEIGDLRQQLNEIQAAKMRAERELETVTAKAQQELREKDRDLGEEIGKKDLLLQMREAELKALRPELAAVSLQLGELAAAKLRAEETLREELQKEKQHHEAGKLAYRQLEERHENETKRLGAKLKEYELSVKRRDEELRALEREKRHALQQLAEGRAAKDQIEKSFREELEKQRLQSQTSEASARKSEQRYRKEIADLQKELQSQQRSRKIIDDENLGLKAQVGSLAQQLEAALANEQSARLLHERLKEENAGFQASDSVLREIEEGFRARIGALEEQLAAKQHLVGSRDAEVATLKSDLMSLGHQVNDLAAAKARVESMLEDAVKERTDLLQSKSAGIRRVEEDLNGKIRELESRLQEREVQLRTRETELDGFKHRLDDLAKSQEEASRALHQDLRDKAEQLGVKETALGALEERFHLVVRDLEGALSESQKLLAERETEIETLLAERDKQAEQLAGIEASGNSTARSLEDELRRTSEMLQSKETAMKALNEQLNGRLSALENQLSLKQEILAARDAELNTLTSKVSQLTQKLNETGAERERSDRLFQEELREKTVLLKSNESSLADLDERFKGRIESLERQLAEKQKLLESSGSQLDDLRREIKALSERLDEAETAKINLENRLQGEKRNAADRTLAVLPTADAEGKALDNGHGMDTLLNEREKLLQARDKLIQNLMTELKEKKTQLAKQEIEVWKGIERRDAWKHRLAKVGIRLKD